VCNVLATPDHRRAIGAASERILEHLRAADASGREILRLPGDELLKGLTLVPCADFALRETVLNVHAHRR